MRKVLAGVALAVAVLFGPLITPDADAMQRPCPGIRPCVELPEVPPMPWEICQYAYCQFP